MKKSWVAHHFQLDRVPVKLKKEHRNVALHHKSIPVWKVIYLDYTAMVQTKLLQPYKVCKKFCTVYTSNSIAILLIDSLAIGLLLIILLAWGWCGEWGSEGGVWRVWGYEGGGFCSGEVTLGMCKCNTLPFLSWYTDNHMVMASLTWLDR